MPPFPPHVLLLPALCSMNLVPYPRQHFLLSSMSPLAAPKDMGKLVAGPKAMDQVLTQWEAQCVEIGRAHV